MHACKQPSQALKYPGESSAQSNPCKQILAASPTRRHEIAKLPIYDCKPALKMCFLQYPIFAFLTGMVYDAGRIVYFQGYSTGVPKNRLKGSFMYLGIVGQLLAALLIAAQCLLGKA